MAASRAFPRTPSLVSLLALLLIVNTVAPLNQLARAQDFNQSDAAMDDADNDANNPEPLPSANYTVLMDQAMVAYRRGEGAKAIEWMLKAYRLAPDNPVVLNNLSASYMQRGVYYQNTAKNQQQALSDYRNALYYLQYAWPTGTPKTQMSEANLKILRSNIERVLSNLKVGPKDWNWHMKSASALRQQGKLQEALVEYAWATDMKADLGPAWMAQGDIYTVLQKPQAALTAFQRGLSATAKPSAEAYIKLGTAFVQANQPDKAAETFNRALAIQPGNSDALLALEQIWKNQIVLNPRNFSAHLNLGAVYQQLARYEEAHAQYQIAARLSPGNPLVQMNLGSLYQAQGNLPQAQAAFDALLKQNPNNSQVLRYQAEVLKASGKPQEAEALLLRALEQPNADQAAIKAQLLGLSQSQHGATVTSATKTPADWKRLADRLSEDAQMQYQAGLAAHEAKDYDTALTYYQRAIRLKPDMAEAHANLGTALHALNRDDEALSALRKALALNADLPEVKDLVAAIERGQGSKTVSEATRLHEAGRFAEAARLYETALKTDSNNAALLANYGLTLQAQQKYKEALTAYDKALALSPDSAVYYYYKGTAYEQQNRLSEARSAYQQALSRDANLAEAKTGLERLQTGETEAKLAQALDAYNRQAYPQALTLIDSVQKTDPNNAMAYYYRGLVYDAQKRLDLARTAYEKALSLDATLADAKYALAVVLDNQGLRSEARTQYQQFVQMMQGRPEDEFIRYAKARLLALK